MLHDTRTQEFGAKLRGRLLRPADAEYEQARNIWNAMIDRRPELIARCATSEDVVQAVRFAREHNLLATVRGGGHNVAGNAVGNGGLMIDLSQMKGIRVDPARQIAEAQPGLTLAEFDQATQAVGLATTMGAVSMTGIAGLTLGDNLWLLPLHTAGLLPLTSWMTRTINAITSSNGRDFRPHGSRIPIAITPAESRKSSRAFRPP